MSTNFIDNTCCGSGSVYLFGREIDAWHDEHAQSGTLQTSRKLPTNEMK